MREKASAMSSGLGGVCFFWRLLRRGVIEVYCVESMLTSRLFSLSVAEYSRIMQSTSTLLTVCRDLVPRLATP